MAAVATGPKKFQKSAKVSGVNAFEQGGTKQKVLP